LKYTLKIKQGFIVQKQGEENKTKMKDINTLFNKFVIREM